VLNLAVWFGIHALFGPKGFDWFIATVMVISFAVMVRWNVGITKIVIAACVAGMIFAYLR